MVEKKYIQKSKSFVIFLIVFIPKSDEFFLVLILGNLILLL